MEYFDQTTSWEPDDLLGSFHSMFKWGIVFLRKDILVHTILSFSSSSFRKKLTRPIVTLVTFRPSMMFSLLFPPGNERKSSIQQCQGQKLDLLIWLWQVCTLGIHNIIVHSGQTLTSVAHYLHTSDKAPALMNVFTKRFIVENNVPATYSLYVCIHYPIIVMKMY